MNKVDFSGLKIADNYLRGFPNATDIKNARGILKQFLDYYIKQNKKVAEKELRRIKENEI